MKFRLIKYLIPFIFLTLGIKGILCAEGYKQIDNSKVTKFKIPTRSTHSDSPDVVDDFVATSHINSEESDDSEDDDYYALWFPRTSKDDHHVYINHSSVSYVYTSKITFSYLQKIYLKIRILRL
ncbi:MULTISPECIES: hypothetical protein [unclassified Arcicella]|uniref:hypothetical protein n=1 Tax=unclassified Arcicella TaxID=2644986 RepID=UPI002864DFA2|nr:MULTISPECIES: hypothetical protein [unclassified Arcicella]MDR6563991.1 hypothetical protein [Arcicella sp. BE51]MDR6813744.1 hypothetical protein [Arcicella sp. BE140]MDR6825056.1 hypothetical protein [Arcicella sp. BE139]